MTGQGVVGAIVFLMGIGCIVRANILFREIVAKINQLLPADRAISLAGFVRHRFFEILGEYRKLYPDGKLVLKFPIWSAIGFAFFFGCAGYWFISGAASAAYIVR